MEQGTCLLLCGKRSSAVLPPVDSKRACWGWKRGSRVVTGEVGMKQATVVYWLTCGITWLGAGA
jgi:hypothetical protein